VADTGDEDVISLMLSRCDRVHVPLPQSHRDTEKNQRTLNTKRAEWPFRFDGAPRFRSAHDRVVYRVVAALLVAALYALHQDVWFWREARPLVFGFLPVGLFYHAAYTIATSGLLWMLVRSHWPAHLEDRSHE
jgi:hypothetical protein